MPDAFPWRRALAIAARVVLSAPLGVMLVRLAIGAMPPRPELVWPGVLGWWILGVFITSYRPLHASAEDGIETSDGLVTFIPFFATFLLGTLPVLVALGSGAPGIGGGAGIFWLLGVAEVVLSGFAVVALVRARRFAAAFEMRAGRTVVEGTLETPLDGTSAEVRLSGGHTIVLAHVERATDEQTATVSGGGRSATTTIRHVAPVGGHALVAGTFEPEQTRLSASSRGSLVLWACGPDAPARARLAARVRTLVLLVLQVALPTLASLYALWRA